MTKLNWIDCKFAHWEYAGKKGVSVTTFSKMTNIYRNTCSQKLYNNWFAGESINREKDVKIFNTTDVKHIQKKLN